MRKVFPPSPPETPRSGLRPLRIRELGAAVGVEVETIRYYEKAGLLPSPVRSDNGYRAYGQEYVQRLAFIRHCRSLDMSLADVAQLLGLMDNPAADGCGSGRLGPTADCPCADAADQPQGTGKTVVGIAKPLRSPWSRRTPGQRMPRAA